jgi:hypothetical protein
MSRRLSLVAGGLAGAVLFVLVLRATFTISFCCGDVVPEGAWLSWAAGPAGWCGLALMAVPVIGAIWLVLPMRHAKAVLAVIAATALGLVGVGAGIPYYRYRHVETAEVAILARLVPPPGASDVRTTLGSEPANNPDNGEAWVTGLQAALVAGPFDAGFPYSVPTAVRSWRVPTGMDACAQTGAIAKKWEPLLGKADACEMNGDNREFGFWAYVIDGGRAGTYAVFWLAPDAYSG